MWLLPDTLQAIIIDRLKKIESYFNKASTFMSELSNSEEMVILVDENDHEVGEGQKMDVHKKGL